MVLGWSVAEDTAEFMFRTDGTLKWSDWIAMVGAARGTHHQLLLNFLLERFTQKSYHDVSPRFFLTAAYLAIDTRLVPLSVLGCSKISLKQMVYTKLPDYTCNTDLEPSLVDEKFLAALQRKPALREKLLTGEDAGCVGGLL